MFNESAFLNNEVIVRFINRALSSINIFESIFKKWEKGHIFRRIFDKFYLVWSLGCTCII